MGKHKVYRHIKAGVALTLLLAASGVAGSVSAQSADSATINVTGNIKGSCSLSSPNTLQLSIGDIAATDLASSGSRSKASATGNITIACTGNPGITMRMTGTQLSGGPSTVLALDSGSSVATGVGVEILNNGNAIVLNQTNNITSSSTVTVPLTARYYSLGNPTAGTANATATLNFTFN